MLPRFRKVTLRSLSTSSLNRLLSFADALRYIGDPHFHEVEVEGLLSEPFIASRRELIQLDKALAAPTAGRLRGDTTYFTIVDKNRNAVSFITSLSDMFGSGMVAGDTGILLHNRRQSFLSNRDILMRSVRGSGHGTAFFRPWFFRTIICVSPSAVSERICSLRVKCRFSSTCSTVG